MKFGSVHILNDFNELNLTKKINYYKAERYFLRLHIFFTFQLKKSLNYRSRYHDNI